jgi:four helix bundle protein
MDYKELDVWNAGLDFVVHVYQVTNKFPKEESYGLTSQIRRAVVSIPSNIAEGAARKSDKEFIQFLHIALGSLAEAETQLIIAERLKFAHQIEKLFHEIGMLRLMLVGLLRYVRGDSGKGNDKGSGKGND